MTITAALVAFASIWFLTFFCVLPLRFQSQGDAGEIVPGTPASAPADAQIARKAKITTVVTSVIFALVYALVTSGLITAQNMDVFHVIN
jgi:predicted secreted protein